MTPRVDVVLVNWNSGPTLSEALASIDSQSDVTTAVTVVDNASNDDSVARALAGGVEFRLLETGRNAGYTGGNNAAFATLSLANPVLVMNPDASFTNRNGLAKLVERLGAGVAAVGPTLLVAEGGPLEYTGTVSNPRRALVSKTGFRDPTSTLVRQSPEVPWLDGAALLLSAEAIRSVGGFDDRYFLFFDEVDWCTRARRAGWSLVLARDVAVLHRRSSSFGLSTKGTYYYWRNLWLFASSHGGVSGRAWAAARVLYNGAAMAVARDRRLGQLARGFADGVRHRYGPGPMDQNASAVRRVGGR